MLQVKYALVALADDAAIVSRVASLAPALIRATGPISYDFQFGPNDLLARIVGASWFAPGTLFAAAGATVALDGEALAGLELGSAGGDFYRSRDNLAGLAPDLIARGGATPEELMGLAERAEEASYLNAYIPDHAYYLFALATVPLYRGRGAGSALLRAAVERARAAGFRELHLDVLADNPAVKFYADHGLRVLSEARVPRLCREHAFPSELRMALTL